jgi:hypothetical protein
LRAIAAGTGGGGESEAVADLNYGIALKPQSITKQCPTLLLETTRESRRPRSRGFDQRPTQSLSGSPNYRLR